MKNKYKKAESGFTLIELLVVIAIIGFLATISIYFLNVVKVQGRDANRAANVVTIGKAMAVYVNEYNIYPVSNGECLSNISVAGAELIVEKMITEIPADPMFPDTAPNDGSIGCTITSGRVTSCPAGTRSFCFWYQSAGSTYNISYRLEIDSKSGDAGIHIMTPSGI